MDLVRLSHWIDHLRLCRRRRLLSLFCFLCPAAEAVFSIAPYQRGRSPSSAPPPLSSHTRRSPVQLLNFPPCLKVTSMTSGQGASTSVGIYQADQMGESTLYHGSPGSPFFTTAAFSISVLFSFSSRPSCAFVAADLDSLVPPCLRPNGGTARRGRFVLWWRQMEAGKRKRPESESGDRSQKGRKEDSKKKKGGAGKGRIDRWMDRGRID